MADMNKDLRVTYELVQTKVQDKAAKQSEKSLSKLTASAANTQATMAAAAGAAVGAIAAIAGAMFLTVGAASKFEESFAGIRKTVDGSEADFRKLGGQIRDLALDIPVTTSALNQIGELGGQLGVSISGLENFIETIAKLGVATRLSTENAALGLARLSEIFQLPEGEIDNLASSLVDLGNNFAALEDEILSTSLRLAAGAKVAGATVSDVLGIATALQAVGVQSQAGGTAMARVFQQIQIAASSGGKQLETFTTVTGLTVQEFQSLARENPAQVLNIFVQELARISKEGGNTVAILDDLGLKQQRTIRALLAVGEAGDLLTRTLVTANTAFEANIALQEEAEKRFETFKSQTKLLGNEITELRIQIGNKLLPAAKALISVFTALVAGFNNADTTSKSLAVTTKALFTAIITLSGAVSTLTFLKTAIQPILAANAMTHLELAAAIKAGEVANLKYVGAATKMLGIMRAMKIAIPVIGIAVAALSIGTAAYRRNQEKANEAAEEFLDNRAASVSITDKVIAKENELAAARGRTDVSDARIEFLEAELEALKEIEARIKASTMQNFFENAGLNKEEAESAQLAIADVSKEVSNFFEKGIDQSFKTDIFDATGGNVLKFSVAESSLAELDEALEGIGTSFAEVSQDPEQMFASFAVLEQQGIPAFQHYEDILKAVNQATSVTSFGQMQLSDASKEGIANLLGNADALNLVKEAMGQVDLEGDALNNVIQTQIDAFNALESRQGETAITLEDVQNDFSVYVQILKELDAATQTADDSQKSLLETAFQLSDQVNENIIKLKEFSSTLESLGRIAPKSLDAIFKGMERTEERTVFLRQEVIKLAKDNTKLAIALTQMPIEESIGLLLSLAEATPEQINEIEEAIVSTNDELRNLVLDEDQIAAFVSEQKMALGAADGLVKLNAAINVEAEGQLQKQMDLNAAALEAIQMSREEAEAQENIADLKEKIKTMNEDLVVGQLRITQEKMREVELLEAQDSLAESIRNFGLEGVITNEEELNILQQQMNLTRMRDKLEGKMSNRDKQRLRDKEKEVKFLKLAVEQGVAEQLDLDVAQDELDKLKDPLTDNEEKMLDLQVKIAEAELALAEAQAKRLDGSVISAMQEVNDATNLGAVAADAMAEAESDLAEALLDAKIQASGNRDRMNELLLLYPNLKGAITDVAKDIGIPQSILDATLVGIDQSKLKYEEALEEYKRLGREAMFDIEEIADYIENALNIDLNLPSAEEIAKNMGIPYGDVDVDDINRRQYYLPQFGSRMNNYTGGNVPIGRTSVVGELGPETIMSTPSGTSVFANRQNASSGGVTVANMNVNITGLPADPISARKAAINIRRELNKLESEGTAGTGLRNR